MCLLAMEAWGSALTIGDRRTRAAETAVESERPRMIIVFWDDKRCSVVFSFDGYSENDCGGGVAQIYET